MEQNSTFDMFLVKQQLAKSQGCYVSAVDHHLQFIHIDWMSFQPFLTHLCLHFILFSKSFVCLESWQPLTTNQKDILIVSKTEMLFHCIALLVTSIQL